MSTPQAPGNGRRPPRESCPHPRKVQELQKRGGIQTKDVSLRQVGDKFSFRHQREQSSVSAFAKDLSGRDFVPSPPLWHRGRMAEWQNGILQNGLQGVFFIFLTGYRCPSPGKPAKQCALHRPKCNQRRRRNRNKLHPASQPHCLGQCRDAEVGQACEA